jgi:NAD-dependent dihydropyrimidine dehydrogenase PreA subunit
MSGSQLSYPHRSVGFWPIEELELAEKLKRNIVRIDESLCDGCGACVISCVEGALKIIDGKAKLVSETYCDGLGACLGECPQGAIIIETREAEGFDEAAAVQHQASAQRTEPQFSCPSSRAFEFSHPPADDAAQPQAQAIPSYLGHWPVQLALLQPAAPLLKGADLLLTADCVPFAYGDFHRQFLSGHALAVACPKLDDTDAHLAKLAAIFRESGIKGVTVVRMEVPCCGGLTFLAEEALKLSGKVIPVTEVVIGVQGDIKRTVQR